MVALLIGSALAVAGLAYVLWPVLQGDASRSMPAPAARDAAPESSAIEALREIEFDQATGKISAEDYAALKASYTPRALAELREREATAQHEPLPASALEAADAAEVLIAQVRRTAAARGGADGGATCVEHGRRPEPDAIFCSECGRYLADSCLKCGARVAGARARFCTECGASLAA